VLSIEQIVEWRGQDVFDAEGERLGKLDEVYYDRASGRALLGSIKSGLLGRRATLVPLDRASAGREYVRVAYPARQVKELDGVEIADTLSADTLRQVRSIYGVRLDDGVQVESAARLDQRRGEAEAARQAEELARQSAGLGRLDDA